MGRSWYDYYAGYSAEFVEDVLEALVPSNETSLVVVDPWNGSGTTTAVAAAKGHAVVGIDRNPALVTIAKGRHLPVSSVEESLQPLRAEIVSLAKSLTGTVRRNIPEGEELQQWFTLTSVARLRALERATYKVLVDEDGPATVLEPVTASSLSSLASFFYCALFTITRQLTASFRTSNPTWIRSAQSESSKVEVSWSRLEKRFEDVLDTLIARLSIPARAEANTSLFEGSAEKMSLSSPADVILTSPPYCTRIDYVVATKPELAIMGNDAFDMHQLRGEMLGSPLTAGIQLDPSQLWGEIASEFLQKVYAHKSKAAKTYYYRYYLAYLDGLYRSLDRLSASTKEGGTIGLVVQDSYFKDVHLDLPAIVAECGGSFGREASRLDFSVARTKAVIHPGSRAYRKQFGATESLVILE